MTVGASSLQSKGAWEHPLHPRGARGNGLAAIILGVLTAVAAPAVAQTPPGASGGVPPGSPIPRILPPAPPAVSPETAVPPLAAPETEVPNRPVNVAAVTITGVTVYPLAEIQQLAQGLVGAAVPLPRIDAARQAILQRYRDDGYVLTTVSVHLDAAGQLRLEITEGHIASVKLDGDIGPAGVQVLRFLNRLTEQQPINAATLERYLLLAQDVPGVTLHAVLQPSTDEPGALTLVAVVSRKAFSGLATVDNRAYRLTGPIEGLTVLDANSFTQFGEENEVSLYHTFPNSETFGQASTEMFLGSSGLRLKIYGGSGRTNPTGSLGAVGFQGITTVFGAMASYPVIRSRQQTLNVHVSFDGLDSTINTGATTNTVRQSYDSLRVLRASADYALADLWLGGDRPATDAASVRLSQGLDILGATAGGDSVEAPRQGERTDFTKVDFNLSRTQTLFRPWTNASVALMGLLTGQWSNDILPPAEQFYLGGSSFTRGYYSGQISGDKALAATVELQLNTGFTATVFDQSYDVSTQYYLFYDWGETWQNLSADANARVSSAGGGARLLITKYTELDLEGLERFNRYPNGSGADISALNATAFYWRVLARF
jgi:hemolysin activation/secretion protein